jgi:hypothetical protein
MPTAYRHTTGAFKLVLPEDWEYAVRRSSVAFFDPSNGVGAMNVSAMIPQKGVPVDPTLVVLDFAPMKVRAEIGITSFMTDTRANAVYTEYEINGDAWRLWVFCGPTRVVVVSYNCKRDSKGIVAVDQIVASIVAA